MSSSVLFRLMTVPRYVKWSTSSNTRLSSVMPSCLLLVCVIQSVTMEKNNGESRQICLTLVITPKAGQRQLLWMPWHELLLYFEAPSSLSGELHSAAQFSTWSTVSKALRKSMKFKYSRDCHSTLCSLIIGRGGSPYAFLSACCGWLSESSPVRFWCALCWTVKIADTSPVVLDLFSLAAWQCTHCVILMELFSIPRLPGSTCR